MGYENLILKENCNIIKAEKKRVTALQHKPNRLKKAYLVIQTKAANEKLNQVHT